MKGFFFVSFFFLTSVCLIAQTEPERIKNLITEIESRSDIDPDSFATDIIKLENELQKLEISSPQRPTATTTTLRAILHGILATAYYEMKGSHISDFDDETQTTYTQKAQQHFVHILDDMETLSKEVSRPYVPLIKQGKGSRYFGYNMLAVMLDFVESHRYILDGKENTPFYRPARQSGPADTLTVLRAKARNIFRANGDRNSETMLRLRQLQEEHDNTPGGRQAYCRALQSLKDSTSGIEAGKLVANTLEREINSVMATSVNIQIAENILAGKPFKVRLEATNATNVTLQVLRYNGRAKNGLPRTDGKQLIRRQYTLSSAEAIARGREMYLAVKDSCCDSIALDAGRYVLKATGKGDTSIAEVNITSLHHAVFCTPDQTAHAFALDRVSGMPLGGISILLSKNNREEQSDTLVSNKNGEVIFSAKNHQLLRAVRDPAAIDTYREDGTEPSYIHYYHSPIRKDEMTHGNIFTDRAIYRPGQTVRVSALLYSMLGDETRVISQGEYLLTLCTPDGEETQSQPLSPNAFGTLSCEFTLPASCKLGSYRLLLKSQKDAKQRWQFISSSTIDVEEYKRPTYSTEFQKDTTVYAPEDSLIALLKAETFSGIPVAEAKVHYTIEFSKQQLWFWGRMPWQNVADKTVTTDAHGETHIALRPSSFSQVRSCMDEAREGEKLIVRIRATVTDHAGESHQAAINYVFPLKPKKKAEEEKKEPLKVSRSEAQPGETIDIEYTPEDKEAYVFYYALAGDKVIDQTAQIVRGTLHRRLYCKKEWGDGATVSVFYVKNGLIHQEQKTITIPKPDKKLRLSWHTFRDRLTPGQQETWTLTVRDKQDQPVGGAELLACMYDASLDDLNRHQWDFSIPFIKRLCYLHSVCSHPTYSQALWLTYQPETKNLMPDEFDLLEGYQGMGRHTLRLRGTKTRKYEANTDLKEVPVLMASASPQAASVANNKALQGKIAGLDIATADAQAIEIEEESESSGQVVSLRSDFNETAFFLPHLTTDGEGNAQVSFTLPESLTEWKFMGFAHTADVRYGLITASATASKDFMVQPQLPRFLRTSDEATLQTRIFNRSDENIDGTATLRCLSAKDETTCLYTESTRFMVEKGGSCVVTFHIARGQLAEDVICEVSASDGTCTDGERNLLPVLQAKESVTENIPFYLDKAGIKEVDLTALYNAGSPTATNRTLSIGYTDNPALDVFQQLSALQLPSHENAPCYAAALYSNTVMLSLHDRLSVLGDSVISHFDPSEAEHHAQDALQKLKDLQQPDGAWSWFKGMEGSAYITLAVAEHLGKLRDYLLRNRLSTPAGMDKMFDRALDYLDKYEQKEFTRRKTNKWPLRPSEFDLRYLAICRSDARTLTLSTQHSQMVGTYLTELNKSLGDLTIYGRAQGACILHKFGRKTQANKFTKSVKHYLVHKPGLGSYFATDRAYYSWQDYRIPTQLAAMRCLSLSTTNEQATLCNMQLWLLRQKQTQLWDNPLNGIDVADYLLTISPTETVRLAETPQMELDGKPVLMRPEGNRLTAMPQIADSVSLLTVEKQSPGISWGYVRGTFLEDADKLEGYTTGELSLQRKLYLKQGNEWVEAPTQPDGSTKETPLTIGSIIRVRHIIHADRDMDFVRITSPHAACLEPLHTRSGYQWTGNRGCYMELHDTQTCIFFDWFRRGTTTVDIDYYVTRSGQYQSGTASAQCEYAPEFGGYCKVYQINVAQ